MTTLDSNDSPPATAANPSPVDNRSGTPPGPTMTVILLQLLMAMLVVQLFEVEQRRSLLTVLIIAVAGTVVLPFVPQRWRTVFPAGLTCLAIILLCGWHAAGWIVAIAGLLIGICYLPFSFRLRSGLLVAAAALVTWQRVAADDIFWPIVGSMFMFRLLVFMYETRRMPRLPPIFEALPYFFLLPNICFVLFPVVDFNTWKRTREETPTAQMRQTGVNWIVLGIIHLLIYRSIRYWFLIPPDSITSFNQLLLFLATNYGLYLHVAGQFHISIGILHLFGYGLPKSHDWFFLASSFTDIWRRINIYWKDFMSALFFMPTYFRVRSRFGDRTAICVAVGVTFFATWLAHSWQTFWLLGRFPLTQQDALLWLTAGLVVGVNSLLDYRKARQKPSAESGFSATSAAMHTIRVAAVFLCVSLFWAQWTNPGILVALASSDLSSLFADSSVVKLIGAVVAVIATGTVLQLVLHRLSQRAPVHPTTSNQRRIVLNLAATGVLLIAAIPSMAVWLPNDAARIVATFRSDHFTQSESSRMVQGYYEELTEGSLQAAVYGQEDTDGQSEKAKRRQQFLDCTRHRNDALELELIPNFKGEYAGQTFTINSWGMRNPEIHQAKADGTFRLAVLGSSVAMGYGVGDSEDFCRLLESHLNSAEFDLGPYQRAEVLNFGMGQYCVIHQMLQLRIKVLDFDPDVVLYLCHQSETTTPALDLAKMRAKNLVDDPGLSKIVRDAGITSETAGGTMRTLLLPFGRQIVEYCYSQMVQDCRKNGIAPVWGFLNMPGSFLVTLEQEEIQPVARDAGFLTLDLTGWDQGHPSAEIMLREGDPHPNPVGHQLILEQLLSEFPPLSEL